MKIAGDGSSVDLNVYMNNLKDKQNMDSISGKSADRKTNADRVALSPKAKEIAESAKIIKAMPDIREEKVAAIKEDIKNGTYKIDGQKVAFNMIKESILNEWL